MMGALISQIARAAVLPGVIDLKSSTKKEIPKLKFPKSPLSEGNRLKRFVPKKYTKGSNTRKAQGLDKTT
tara:strand:+ start:331 stop:540 length:210 start_codon:yes stop_codon:yes gene_type:complete